MNDLNESILVGYIVNLVKLIDRFRRESVYKREK